MRRRALTTLAAWLALGIALACGDVPTLPGGVAYITPVLLPSPTVAFGDTLRDSTGKVAPLRVFAVGRDSTDTITDVTLRFILTSLRTGATINENGYLVAPESLTTVRVVAQVTGAAGLQLQTPEITIDVVPLADSIAPTTAASAADTAVSLPIPPRVLSATVTGVGPGGTRGTVAGIRVRYRISEVYPAGISATGRYYLVGDGGTVLRPDSTVAIDTTGSNGVASRSFVGVRAVDGGANADSVVVTATATSQRGVPLRGSPARFVLRFRKD
jgi:hypothetical protein